MLPSIEGCMWTIARRDGLASPGWVAVSRMKGSRREPGDPTGAIDRSSMGVRGEGRPEPRAELRSGVGPARSTDEALEGTARAGSVEGRGWRGGNSLERARDRTLSRVSLLPHLQRVHDAARHDKRAQFTALLHHVDVVALARAFRRLKRNVSAGIDGVTVMTYEQDLERNLQALGEQVHTGRYRPLPVRRVFIPKSDGGQRPLGVPSLEDKVVQGAVAEVLNAIYEVDFLGFSYGFRPRRNPHQALTALHTAVIDSTRPEVPDRRPPAPRPPGSPVGAARRARLSGIELPRGDDDPSRGSPGLTGAHRGSPGLTGRSATRAGGRPTGDRRATDSICTARGLAARREVPRHTCTTAIQIPIP